MMSVNGSPKLKRWFEQEYRKAGRKLDMGKSCVRFRSLDDLPLDVIGKAIAAVSVDEYVAHYEASRPRRSAPRKPAAKARAAARKPAAARTRTARKASPSKPARRRR